MVLGVLYMTQNMYSGQSCPAAGPIGFWVLQDAPQIKSQGEEPGKVFTVVSWHLNDLCLWVS